MPQEDVDGRGWLSRVAGEVHRHRQGPWHSRRCLPAPSHPEQVLAASSPAIEQQTEVVSGATQPSGGRAPTRDIHLPILQDREGFQPAAKRTPFLLLCRARWLPVLGP